MLWSAYNTQGRVVRRRVGWLVCQDFFGKASLGRLEWEKGVVFKVGFLGGLVFKVGLF